MSFGPRLTWDDWAEMCRLMVERPDGWTFAELGHELGISADVFGSRMAKLEARHGQLRTIEGRDRTGRKTVFNLSRQGRAIATAIASGNPVPTGRKAARVKRSAVEAAYLALRETFTLPPPVEILLTVNARDAVMR